jgi:hypothetical protein
MKSHLKKKHRMNLPDDEMDALLISLQVPRDAVERPELTPFTDADELPTPPIIKQHLPSPEPSHLLGTQLSKCSGQFGDELALYPTPTFQIHGQDLSAYPQFYRTFFNE